MELIEIINNLLNSINETSFSLTEYQKEIEQNDNKEKNKKTENENLLVSDILKDDDIQKAANLTVDDFYVFYVKGLNNNANLLSEKKA